MTEVEFFHHASRTLVLTDFVENFEPHKLDRFVMRWLTRIGGVQHPDGRMPRDMRLTFARRKPQLRAAIEKMIAWNPERNLAHGRWYERDGTAGVAPGFSMVARLGSAGKLVVIASEAKQSSSLARGTVLDCRRAAMPGAVESGTHSTRNDRYRRSAPPPRSASHGPGRDGGSGD